MNRSTKILAFAVLACGLTQGAARAGFATADRTLAANAAQDKYTFLLFYRENNAATRAMAQSLQTGLSPYADRAAVAHVSVTNPAEQAIVKQFGVARAPLPFVLAVAPNGAITALASQKISGAQIASAFVTPGMADCMKAMQERKLVLVCVKTSSRSATPPAVADFQSDPDFMDRLHLITVQANDAAETPFLKQMEIEPASLQGTTMVFMAPPAVLVGKFTSTATKAEMAAALHAAGKCCDDPNCKHNHGKQATKSSSTKRN